MKWIKFLVILTLFCFVFAENTGANEEVQENDRALRGFEPEDWPAVEVFSDGRSIWVPYEKSADQSEAQPPKRRRLRKRKRRPSPPPAFTVSDEEETAPERASPRRKLRPQRLEQLSDPWEEMSEDALKKPNIRRRVTPVFQPPEDVIVNNEETFAPVTIRIEEETENKKKEETNEAFYGKRGNQNREPERQTASVADIKTLLKQSGSKLSLSEILQQKNLSLSELLMGNQKAISALTEKPLDVSESASDNVQVNFQTDNPKYKRLPSAVGGKRNQNRNYEQDLSVEESPSPKQTLEIQRKRLALLHHNDNKLFSSVTKYDVITELTTEKRIFVPSHPKYYTSLNFKPNFNLYNEDAVIKTTPPPQQEVTTTTLPPKTMQAINENLLPTKSKHLPITNAKIIRHKPKSDVKQEEPQTENYPVNFPTPIKIDIHEVFGFQGKETTTETPVKEDEPLRMSIDLENLMDKTTNKIEEENYIPPKTTYLRSEEELITTTEPPPEKLISVTAKDEIMEVLKDPISRERLSRILETRNMTLQELVDQRERGSSQRHLADIFHNKTREPEPIDEPFVGHVNTPRFDNLPPLGRKQKSSFGNEHPTEPGVRPTAVATEIVAEMRDKPTAKPKETYSVTSFPTFKIEVPKDRKEYDQPFLWRELYPDLFPRIHEGNYKKEDLTNPSRDPDEDVQRLDDVENTVSFSSNEKLNVEEDRLGDEGLVNIPSGVKSAIFVSLAIIGLSIVVFLTILLVFRWTQKQKRTMNYCNSLSSRIKVPIITQNRPANAIKSFVNETLGRKKLSHYYKSNVQSIADDMWDDCRDRKPSF